MPVGYRAVWDVRDAVAVAETQFRSWLRARGCDADAVAPGVHVLGEQRVPVCVTELKPGDGSRSVRYRLADHPGAGEWSVTLTAHEPGDAGDAAARDGGPGDPGDGPGSWIWADASESAVTGWAPVPALVRAILTAAEARDGQMRLREEVEDVTAAGADRLCSVVCDEARRGAAIVAAPAQLVNAGSFRARVRQLTGECAGLAGLYLLDEPAAALLRTDWSPTHDIEPGAIRVFLPGADPASGRDARRHRVLPANMVLVEDPGTLARYLGAACRKRAAELPLPERVAVIDRLLGQAEHAVFAEARARTERARTERARTEHARAERARTERDSPEGAPDAAALEASDVVAGLQAQVTELTESLGKVRAELESERLENAVTNEELLVARETIDRLRTQLAAAGQRAAADAVAAEVLPGYPKSFMELLGLLRQRRLPRVVFTGKPADALALDDYDPDGTWAKKTWQILRVLDGYAEARRKGEFGQGMRGYLEQTPAGRPGYSVHAYAAHESDLVANTKKYRSHRTLPVPPDISPDGMLYMPAHFKITQHGLISPRLYYHDDTTGTGKIYVGYIGRHLPNSHTN